MTWMAMEDSTPSLKTISFWINEFKRGRTSTEDEARPGRPIEVTTKRNWWKKNNVLMSDEFVRDDDEEITNKKKFVKKKCLTCIFSPIIKSILYLGIILKC